MAEIDEDIFKRYAGFFASARAAYGRDSAEDAHSYLEAVADRGFSDQLEEADKVLDASASEDVRDLWSTWATEYRGEIYRLAGTIAESWGDTAGALQFFEKSAASGVAFGMIGAARVANEMGDTATARRWYEAATNYSQWDTYAFSRLIAIADVEGHPDEVLKWLTRAAEGGVVDAMFDLGMHQVDNGNAHSGIEWITEAASLHHSGARNWLQEASLSGDPAARKALEEIDWVSESAE